MGDEGFAHLPTEPLVPGDQAPNFSLPAANHDRMVSLADYRGRRPLLLGLFRTLYCPFCRRQLYELANVQPKLELMGVDALAVIIAKKERAQLYFRYQPLSLLVAADQEWSTHRAFGVPYVEVLRADAGSTARWPYGVTPEQLTGILIDPTRELGEARTILQGRAELNRRDGFEATPEDRQMQARDTQLVGLVLIDDAGIIRWRWVEAMERPQDVGTFPAASEILQAAQTVTPNSSRLIR